MTSVHMYAQHTQLNNGVGIDNQSNGIIQSPSKYDEVERLKQRMDNLRKHHNESAEIYNITQPIINEQIREETLKYLKNNQVNGTKTKNQKQRAPKKQRTLSTSNINIISKTIVQQDTITSPANQFLPNTHPTPPLSQPNQIQQQHILLHPPQLQQPITQQTVHMQLNNIQNNQEVQPQIQAQAQLQSHHFKYQPTRNIYQHTQPTMQNNIQYQQPQQHVYPPHQHQMQNQTHIHSQPIELQNQYIVQPTHPHYTTQPFDGTYHVSHQQQPSYISSHTSIAPMNNDLDLTLQAGLECDVDSLIKHEITVEGQLNFNHELLLKLDNHYHGYN